jgi:hypothetical protein
MADERTATMSVKTTLDQRAEADRKAASPTPTRTAIAIDWARLMRVMGCLPG